MKRQFIFQLTFISIMALTYCAPAPAQVTFTDATEVAGLGFFKVSWSTRGDYNNDGDADIVLIGGSGRRLYRNEGNGTFLDVTEAVGITDASVGAGSSRILGEFGYSPISYFRAIPG